ncbi:MARVEL domain-containing protein [Gaoshiqia sp. Z1-71]|uniref:MARVEL domain-containing protein n=1 Tax=Gaoshiqia hydrogeniformans TaxID=3290090 RepID=UPI003BF913BC
METKPKQVFTNKAISIATFIGGPLAAGILISKNYKVFGREEAARNAVFVAFFSTFILFVGLFMVPEQLFDGLPHSMIPLIYTTIIAGLTEKLQGQKIKEFLANDGQKASNWEAAKYGFFGFISIIAFIVLMIYTLPTAGYEKSITVDQHVMLHYSKKMDEAKPRQLAQLINQSRFMEGSEGADLFFSNEPNHYKLKFVIPDASVLADTLLIADFNSFEKYLNYNLNFEKRIEIGFSDINLTTEFDLVESDEPNPRFYEPILYLQKYRINDFQHIYYNANMPLDDVKKVEDSVKRLSAYFPESQTIDIVFLNTGDDYTIKFFVSKHLWQNQSVTERLKSTVDYIQSNGIDKTIKLGLIDIQTFEEWQLISGESMNS